MIEYEIEQVTAGDAAITLAEAKAACRVLHDDEDSYITFLIEAASSMIDGPFGYLGQAVVTQNWKIKFPGNAVRGQSALSLPFGPVTNITSVKTFDGTTLSADLSADFELQGGRFTPSIAPKSGTSWPVLADRWNALQIEFVAGDTAAAVPARIKQAMAMVVAHWFNNREATVIGSISKEIEIGVLGLLQNDRRTW